VAELVARFRGAFLAALRASPLATDAVHDLVRRLYRRRWVVYAKRAFGGADAVYRYLGRYTHHVGISNQRLVSLRGCAVVFRTRGDARMRLPVAEFATCFLDHVLPRGFRKVRHYGLLAPTNVRTRLTRAGQLLHKAPVPPAAPLPDSTPAPTRCLRGDHAGDPGLAPRPPGAARCRLSPAIVEPGSRAVWWGGGGCVRRAAVERVVG
jgi:hypothetical protein